MLLVAPSSKCSLLSVLFIFFHENVVEKLGNMNTANSNHHLVQSETNTTNIYNTIVHLGFNVCGSSGESGKESNLEYEDDHEGTLSLLFDTKSNCTERHLESPSLTTKQEMEHANIAVVNSGGYEDNQADTNILKSNSYTASDDDEMEENPEPESPDPDYVYFGEISLTDLYSMRGFRKDLHDEIADQGYCPLYVAESNLCQYPELLPNGDELGTFSAGRVLPNRRIEDVYGEVLRKRSGNTSLSKYTFYLGPLRASFWNSRQRAGYSLYCLSVGPSRMVLSREPPLQQLHEDMPE